MVNKEMTESFNFYGSWSRPGHENNILTGYLNYDLARGAIILTVKGRKEDIDIYNNPYTELLVGTTDTGKVVTLLHCTLSDLNENIISGLWSAKFYIEIIFVGAQFKSVDDMKFNAISGRFSNLTEWISNPGLKHDFKDLDFVRFEYKRPDSINFTLRDGLSGDFSFGYTIPSVPNGITLTESAMLTIASAEEKSFDELFSDFFFFQNFLSLAQFDNVSVISITICNNKIFSEYFGKKRPRDIEVYFVEDRLKSNREVHKHRMLFDYHEIREDFSNVIYNWYHIKENLEPSIEYLIDSLSTNRTFTVNSFLNIIQAVETFHRRFRNNQVLSSEDFQIKIAAILKRVDDEHKTWLSDRLNFANEPTLHYRIETLLTELTNQTLVKLINDESQFIKDVKNSRNYYTHFNTSLKKKAKTGADLFHLSEVLKVLLVCAILKEVGFSLEHIEKLLMKKESILFNHIL